MLVQAQPYHGTRPQVESPALHQRIMGANAVVNKPPAPPVVHEKVYLNRRQALISKMFGTAMFDRSDIQFPHDVNEKGQKIDDPNVARLVGMANWILFKTRKTTWDDNTLSVLEGQPSPLGMSSSQINFDFYRLPAQMQHQFTIAGKLHKTLKSNEKKGSGRDDAHTFVEGMRVLVQENTHNGKVDEKQLIEDMEFSMIDMGSGNSQSYVVSRLSPFKKSNAAYNLYGDRRIKTVGWNEQLKDDVDPDSNQVHHFAAVFIEAYRLGAKEALDHAEKLDHPIFNKGKENPADILLSAIAVKLATEIKNQTISWQQLPQQLYEHIKP